VLDKLLLLIFSELFLVVFVSLEFLSECLVLELLVGVFVLELVFYL